MQGFGTKPRLLLNRHIKVVKNLSLSLVVILGLSLVSAQAETTTTTIKACLNKKTGHLRVANQCSATEKPLIWNIKGPAGEIGATPPIGEKGATGSAGINGTQIWFGEGEPTASIGAIGDFYVNTKTNFWFGPKLNTWSKGSSIVGPSGPSGATGPQGIKGDTGAQGAGSAGGTGATGADGNVATGGLSLAQLSKCDSNQTTLCKVGGVGPGGGTIFFVDYQDIYTGFNFLEAAPAACETTKAWSSDTANSLTAVSGWAARAVGAGQANTTAMINDGAVSYLADTSGAAFFANALAVASCGSITNSKDDWFLGSLGEMKLIYDNLQGVGGFATAGYYWSSSVYSASAAWVQFFFSGDQSSPTKSTTYYVRPIRAFS